MARLPQPGSDDGTWGDILNDYLSQAHKPDGLLKDNAVTANTIAPNSVTNAAIATDAVNATSIADGSIINALIADGTIQEAKLSSAVQTKLNATATVPDADGSTKGKVQLAGDLGGTAASPRVTGLQGRLVDGSAPADGQVLSYSTTSSSWVPATVSSTTVNDATTSSKGIVQLAGDLGGTASAPTVPGLTAKAPLASPTFTGAVTVPTPTNNTDAATKAYVDGQISGGSTPDADATTKGKLQLAGDLSGTAASPQVAKIQGIAISGTPTNGQVLTASAGTAASWVTPTGTLPSLTSGSVPFSDGTTLAQDNNNFYWDNTNKRLGIGTNAPATALHLSGSTFAGSQIQSYAIADSANPVVSLRRARSGTTAIQSGDIVGGISWRGHDGSNYGSDAASINTAAVSNFTSSNHGTKLAFSVTPDGSTTSTTPMVLYGDHLDLSYDIASPVGTQVGLSTVISGKGDNASWKGVIAGSFQAKDRSDVDATNKGVLMGVLASVVPNISRNNVPYDDVNGIMVSNEGTGKATDAIYIAKHTSFGGQSEWLTTFTSDADADSGMRLMGNYTYQMLNLSNKLMVDATGAMFMADQSEPSFPSGGGIPSGGGLLYVQSGALKYKQSNGTVTTVANGGLLSAPKIDTINDTNGNPALNFSTFFTGSATSNNVNYFTMYNNMPGGLPRLSPDGPDTNIGMSFVPKGTGEILIWSPSDTPTITGGGPSSNQNLNLKSGGTGVVQANGIAVATVSGTQTLTNKTLGTLINSTASTVTAAGTTTLTATSAPTQIFTGTTTQTITLPTTSIVVGQSYQIVNQSTGNVTVNSSDATGIISVSAGSTAQFTALQNTPTAPAHWGITVWPISVGANGSQVVRRDGGSNIFNNNSIIPATTTATAGTTTTLTTASRGTQIFTGTTTQTITLPTTSIQAGWLFTFINQSTGALTINSSAGNLVLTVSAGNTATVMANTSTPTTAAHWTVGGSADGAEILANKTLSAPQITSTASVATGGTLSFYNTSDQTTNYERARHYWNSNVYTIASEIGGTGTLRNVAISASGTTTTFGANIVISRPSSTSIGNLLSITAGGLNSSSGVQQGIGLTPTITQSGTAGYSMLFINPTESSTGSGIKNLADFQVGGTSKTRIDNTGSHYLSSSATNGVVLYNTSDETTNYERVRHYWSSNVYTIGSENGGTGTLRGVQVASSSSSTTWNGASGVSKVTTVWTGSTSPSIIGVDNSGGLSSTSGMQTGFRIAPTINQSSTAGYVALLVNSTETATGSGTKNLADFQVGGTSRTRIDNLGNHIISSAAASGIAQYNTSDETTNYERVKHFWSSNVYTIAMETGGTGTNRDMTITSSSGASGASITVRGAGNFQKVGIQGSTVAATGSSLSVSGTLGSSSGTQAGINLIPTINQSSTAGYTALLVNPTESATGSGTKLLADFQVGGSSKVSITNLGQLKLAASTTSASTMNIPTGAAPTSPATGDIYSDGTHIYCYLASTWKQLD